MKRVLAFSLIMCLYLWAGIGWSDIIQVPGDQPTIQSAIDAAEPGDNINIAAGTYIENVTIPVGKDGLNIIGVGSGDTLLISAGGEAPPKFAPADVPADIVIDVFSPDVSIKHLTIRHPEAVPNKRDIGVFVRPPAIAFTMKHCTIERQRVGNILEPTTPGSRGILVFRAGGTVVENNSFQGNYEDHIHLPTSSALILNNSVIDATRIGIVVIQESPTSLSIENVIQSNTVIQSGSDGIQIQGDDNLVLANRVSESGGAGIKLCGPGSELACVAPGSTATASYNLVKANQLKDNQAGNIVDGGTNNIIKQVAEGVDIEAEDYTNVFFTALKSGLNIISLPLKPQISYTARSFAEEFSATMVIRMDEEHQRFVGFTLDAPDDGFTIEGGKGYIVNVKQSGMVAFTGAAWTNQLPVEVAEVADFGYLNQSDGTWAFVVSGRFEDDFNDSLKRDGYLVTIRNTRTNAITTDVVRSGYFAAAFADLNRKEVVEIGDILEVQVQNQAGEIVSVNLHYTVTSENIRQAFLPITL
ncbi:right-handed parallel beta-helix repeat-containing protein, partial [bacterium]|nr:right-handed parallel beta-helix repeat-containing protein [bacterium]